MRLMDGGFIQIVSSFFPADSGVRAHILHRRRNCCTEDTMVEQSQVREGYSK